MITVPFSVELAGTGELCQRADVRGMGEMGMFPIGDLLSPLTGVATAFITTKSNEKIAKQQEKIARLQMKGEMEQAAREFAVLQAMKQVEPHAKARNSQLAALYAVGGIAALISTYMLVSMARSRER
jgi:hypothetical protein